MLVLLVSVQILVRLDCFSHSITMEVWKPARWKTAKFHWNEHTPGITPRRERQLPRGAPTYDFSKFSQKTAWNWNNLDPHWGAHPSRPPLDPPLNMGIDGPYKGSDPALNVILVQKLYCVYVLWLWSGASKWDDTPPTVPLSWSFWQNVSQLLNWYPF